MRSRYKYQETSNHSQIRLRSDQIKNKTQTDIIKTISLHKSAKMSGWGIMSNSDQLLQDLIHLREKAEDLMNEINQVKLLAARVDNESKEEEEALKQVIDQRDVIIENRNSEIDFLKQQVNKLLRERNQIREMVTQNNFKETWQREPKHIRNQEPGSPIANQDNDEHSDQSEAMDDIEESPSSPDHEYKQETY